MDRKWRAVCPASFRSWLTALKDGKARNRITVRITRAEAGLLGDVKSIADGVSEMRVDYGPGYRLYLTRRGNALIVLLCGGDKGSQTRDIALAKALARET